MFPGTVAIVFFFFQRSSQKPYFTYHSACKTYKLSLKPCLLSRSSTCLTLLYSVARWAAGGCHVKSSLCALFLPFPLTGWAWFGDTCWKCLAGADVQLIVTLHERGNLDAWNDDLCYDLTYNRKKNQNAWHMLLQNWFYWIKFWYRCFCMGPADFVQVWIMSIYLQ